ncbi:MAG: spore germination protein [Desulfosporosinus sp.]|nr:spore germination protein [Desulfosporosinus sp.]
MLGVLDIFHEASLRLPQIIGPYIGIVGALIMYFTLNSIFYYH